MMMMYMWHMFACAQAYVLSATNLAVLVTLMRMQMTMSTAEVLYRCVIAGL
jgi:hypothetical protein